MKSKNLYGIFKKSVPGLTTVRLPLKEIGYEAAQSLLSLMNKEDLFETSKQIACEKKCYIRR